MSAVIVSIRVRVSPQDAFDIFTQEIAAWWRPSGLFEITPRGDGVLQFENGTRLVTKFADGKEFEIGRVTAWTPGERLAFTWRQATFAPDQATHVEVRFEPAGDETRVSVEHRGWDAIPQKHAARHGFPLAATQMRLAEQWRNALAAYQRLGGWC
ncbi:MAG: SRPBCC domain-containing protein [Hyphomonadaceae bacterium]|nr:SRPBCC domain-containing protein [Hyphomonadaceae bacterium]GIK48162.1 MAG: ligand-binding SRPBCC domain protein [Alphaproteobacteria bacterium]